MANEQKTLKQYCKDAKKRLKCGFWQNYKSNLDKELLKQAIDKAKHPVEILAALSAILSTK